MPPYHHVMLSRIRAMRVGTEFQVASCLPTHLCWNIQYIYMGMMRYTLLACFCLCLMGATTISAAAAAVDEHTCDPTLSAFVPVYDLGPGQPATRLLKPVEFAIKASEEAYRTFTSIP